MPVGGTGPLSGVTGIHFQLLCLIEWKPLVLVLSTGFCPFLFPIYSKTIFELLYTFIFLVLVSEYTEVSLYQHLGRQKREVLVLLTEIVTLYSY